VFRVEGRGTYFVKTICPTTADDMRFQPRREADRLRWLGQRGFPVPEVVDVGADAALEWLIVRALPGRPAAGPWSPDEQRAVLDAIADFGRALHASALDECSFDASLSVTRSWAEWASANGAVDLDDLDERYRGWTAPQLLEELAAQQAPAEDLVVCHGDLCLDNLLIDPRTLQLCGVLDAGRLGIADRWRDLAVLLRDVREQPAWRASAECGQALLARYGTAFDPHRAHYYQLLDEFF
jgi:aminoglycoside phosphotransferase